MKICGVVAEYNPFHNGHARQLEKARALSGCDYVIVCMGGGVSQRGEVMLLDKRTRARMALEGGADLVVELPALFAVRPADAFARGGVLTLAGLGVDALSFGCETDDAALLASLAHALDEESAALSAETRRGLVEGKSHARARGEALEKLGGLPEGFLNRPNTALALEYMRAAARLNRPVAIHVVKRLGDYHDATLGPLASASAIRSAVETGGAEAVRQAMPDSAFRLLSECLREGRFARMERLDSLLLYRLRAAAPGELAALCDVSEGIESLFLKHSEAAVSREDLLARVKSKRYTYARLSRFCACALLNLTREDVLAHPAPEYARVLGFRRDALPLLRRLKEIADLPLVTDAVQLRDSPLFRFDRAAADLQALAMENPAFRAAGRDFTDPIAIV
ncbi:MAG: nucleotidyltransferase family protein [Clostridia bacterium]|nr:nucleotidyltransferase family protein [Clostridia bacterium]